MVNAYCNCVNLTELVLNSNKVSSISNMVYGKLSNVRLNIYAYSGTNTWNVIRNVNIVGSKLTWTSTSDESGLAYYNASQNIYIYDLKALNN